MNTARWRGGKGGEGKGRGCRDRVRAAQLEARNEDLQGWPSAKHCPSVPRMMPNIASPKERHFRERYLEFAGPLGLEACVITCSIVNRRSFFSLVGTLRRQIALLAEGSNPLFRQLGAPCIDFLYFGVQNPIDFCIVC